MELLCKLVGLFLSIAGINSAAVATKSYVVSPSSGSENYYLKLNRLKTYYEESVIREDVICANILKSPFFSTENNVEIVDPVNEGQIYAEFHPEMKWHMFKRPYDLVNVSVLQNVTQEAVFPCVARVKGTKELKLYLISHEYNFNDWIKSVKPTKCPEVGGRFIFEYNESKKMAEFLAVAEEPACRLNYFAVNYNHFISLERDLTAISKRGRGICKFEIGRKIRVCAVGLNAKEYRNKITFAPLKSRIEPECEKRELIFKYDDSSFTFNEWVIGCKAELVGKQGFATYYISLGHEPYQLLIYYPMKGGNVSELIHHFYSNLAKDNSDYFGF